MPETERAQQNGAQRPARDGRNPRGAAAALLSPGGSLSRVLPGFESRPQQAEMAAAVELVLDEGGVGIIEAGTGTGKSLAYLAPAVLNALARRRRIVVSTHTHNLQEQLLRSDIPTLQAALGEDRPEGDEPPFTAGVLKGWSNYLCLWRLEQQGPDQSSLFPQQRSTLDRLRRWAEAEDHGGTRDEADFSVPDDMWDDVCAENDTCMRQRCPFYDDCFYFRARRRAQAADILIANHHLVCADFAVRSQVGWDGDIGVLPRTDAIVFDEAHHLEDVFTQHFGLRFSPTRLHRLLRRIQGNTGIIARWQHHLAAAPDGEDAEALATVLAGRLPMAAAAATKAGKDFFEAVAALARDALVRGQDGSGPASSTTVPLARGMIDGPLWQPLGNALDDLHKELASLADLGRAWREDASETEALAWETEALARRTQGAAEDLTALVEGEDGKLVYWLERHGRRREEWALRGAPVEIGPVVQETMLEHVETVVMTSATLSAGDGFQYFKQRLGLEGFPRIAAQRRIPSPFDYKSQVLLCVPHDLPGPEQKTFWPALAEGLKLWLTASEGRAFVLFTSYRALDEVWNSLAPWLAAEGMTGLRQQGAGRAHLLERFRRAPRPVLFGTDSFWEGVDVPGDALSLVVVTRLPFRVPTDPVAAARRDALEARGMDAFDLLTVPQAVMRLRQGFGRLIRTAADRGAVIVADHRIVTRSYGRRFLNALPETARYGGPSASVAAAVADWLDRPARPDSPA